jgi:release factor glutamine methyltransferase
MTLREALAEASTQIARRDAETLLAHLLGRDRAWLLAHPEAELDPSRLETFRDLAVRRAAHEPLQHLTGTQEFYGLALHVTRDTLIPRPETELLVEAVLDWAAHQKTVLRILDVGTGTGAIALALATHLPTAEIVATDLSPSALETAQGNADRLGLAHRIRFLASDLLTELDPETRFDAIVSNPPYIPTGDAPTLQPEVVDYEPHTALFAGSDGLELYRRLIPEAHTALRSNGQLALEFGFGQHDSLRELLHSGWQNIRFLDDYAQIPRIALADRR